MDQTILDRVQAVRALMDTHNLAAWIVNGTDPHQSEYVTRRWRTRAWLTGFTGSSGIAVVTGTEALLWTDSRYFIQARQELGDGPFVLMKMDTPGVPPYWRWLADHVGPDKRVGIINKTLTVALSRQLTAAFEPAGIALVPTSDWFDQIWPDRPALPHEPVFSVEQECPTVSRQEKLGKVREACRNSGCTHAWLSSLDDIAWLFDLRGSDVVHNPVFLAHALVGMSDAHLFVDASRMTASAREALAHVAILEPYEEVPASLGTLIGPHAVLHVNPERTCAALLDNLGPAVQVVEGRDATTDMKAAKSPEELEGMRQAHVLDGIALVKFLHMLSVSRQTWDEQGLSDALESFRKSSDQYLGTSFSPISAFKEHGAMAHYSVGDGRGATISGDGLLVLDTGGQYRTGTTDVTRTLVFGVVSELMRTDYTLVLKGNLALASQQFPEGTCGYQLDVLARQFLWTQGIQYGHGTGHGVGCRLNVHEGPQNISPRPLTVPLVSGMVVSDEPGVYRDGIHGVRLENLLAVRRTVETGFGRFLGFEVLTLCPFDRRLIDPKMLDQEETMHLNAYHALVWERLSPHLADPQRSWLRTATLPL